VPSTTARAAPFVPTASASAAPPVPTAGARGSTPERSPRPGLPAPRRARSRVIRYAPEVSTDACNPCRYCTGLPVRSSSRNRVGAPDDPSRTTTPRWDPFGPAGGARRRNDPTARPGSSPCARRPAVPPDESRPGPPAPVWPPRAPPRIVGRLRHVRSRRGHPASDRGRGRSAPRRRGSREPGPGARSGASAAAAADEAAAPPRTRTGTVPSGTPRAAAPCRLAVEGPGSGRRRGPPAVASPLPPGPTARGRRPRGRRRSKRRGREGTRLDSTRPDRGRGESTPRDTGPCDSNPVACRRGPGRPNS
jgi:hypothetical protein